MNYEITPSLLSGIGSVPSSKSHTLRAIVFATLAHGESIIHNVLPSPDTEAMIRACIALGAKIRSEKKSLFITGTGGNLSTPLNVIDVGNSGQALRFIGAIATLAPHHTILTGDNSICTLRPVAPLLDGLTQLGASAISSKSDSHAPIIVKGPAKAGKITVDGKDSQPVSALLMLAAMLEGTTTIEVTNPGETPWIGMTLYWLKRMGVEFSNDNYHTYTVTGPNRFAAFEYTVPSDWSSATFPIAAAVITNSELTLEHVSFDDPQGDKQFVEVLEKMGAKFTRNRQTGTLHVHSHGGLSGITVNVNDIIDCVPVLAALACYADSPTTILGAGIARCKESDRLSAITTELGKMGAQIEENPDGLVVSPSTLEGANMSSYHDHRIAMALAVATLGARSKSIIQDITCVAKSFPGFAQTMQGWSADICEVTA